MCKKTTYLISFVLVLGLVLPSVAHAVHPTPVAWWKLDGDALDSSGNDRNGTLHGNPQWVPGVYGDALAFDGDDYVTIDGYKGIVTDGTNTSAFTITAWFKAISDGELIGWGSSGDGNRAEFRVNEGRLRYESGGGNVQADTNVTDNKWHHGAVTIPRNAQYVDVTIYLDGKDDTQPENDTDVVHPLSNYDAIMGQRYNRSNSRWYTGAIDDLRIYDVVLTLEQIHEAMAGVGPVSPSASEPGPENGSTDVPRDVVLSWKPGEYAPPVNGHKLYFSENFSDVKDGIGGIIQDANSYTPPQLLDFGKTYYWRVDEVNAPPDSTIFEGELWQFTTEPIGYAIANITATASSVQQASMGPENTVNGSGLDANDLHSTGEMNMWLSSTTGPQPSWIQYEFDKVYKLHEMWVWNSNQSLESVLGFGIKDASIEYSVDGTDYTTLGTTHEFARASGMPNYAHNTTVDFGGVPAKYVRLTANSNWGGFLPQYGLSEVRFLYIPVRAREPSPDSGATDVDVDVTLSFRAGREAAQHDVYLSTDEQAVIDGNVPVTTMIETSHGPLSLDLGKIYYWRVDEVNEAETPTTLKGDVWHLTTREFLVVDDFEGYNDLDPEDPESNRIFLTWLDGYGVDTNGSLVGYAAAPFAEQTIVHSGAQSMPLFYDNSGTARYSETELMLSPAQDWTKHGTKALSLWFYGDPNNVADQMYVKINDSKVVYDGEAADIARPRWKQWNINLASLGANLQNVTKLSIGIDGSGAAGTLYFDDIRLYRLVPEPPLEIWIEAEAAESITEPMKIYPAAGVDPVNDAAGKGAPSGGLYIGTTSDVPGNNDDPGTQDIATYTFTVPAGTYAIWGRVSNVADDSLWVHIPDGQYDVPVHSSGWIRWNSIEPETADWHWVRVFSNDAPDNAVVNVKLTAGEHTILWAHRESGNFLDAFVITDKLD
ncbi:MAG: LamG-like jellyroll fold domain-containing protein [Planctomycetota bacterium]|jgi:hypothetical protein